MSATTANNRARGRKSKQRTAEARGSAACPSCGEINKASARFCQGCGRSLVGGGGWFNAQTLTIIGAAVLTLVALGLLFGSVVGTSPTGDQTANTPARTASSNGNGQPPDLSTMTPREAADRLFNRVMIADEQGNTDEVVQFAPMAVAAYDRLDGLDLDGVYHLGLIHAAAGDMESAKGAIEQLRAAVPGHLLASVLEHRLAMKEGDQAKAESAVERFKNHYDQEIIVDRAEYRHHRRQIDLFQNDVVTAGDNLQ